MERGEVAFTRMEKVIFGEDAAAAAKAEAQRLGAENVFLLVSGTLNRETDEVEKLRQALGNTYCGNPRHLDKIEGGRVHQALHIDAKSVLDALCRVKKCLRRFM